MGARLGGGGPLGWRQHEQRRDEASRLGEGREGVCGGEGVIWGGRQRTSAETEDHAAPGNWSGCWQALW